MCEFCPQVGGPCNICGQRRPRPLVRRDAVELARAAVAEAEADLADARRELAEALVAAGRRPGDGSDQPALFQAAAQPSIF